jgi:hypothetical protein
MNLLEITNGAQIIIDWLGAGGKTVSDAQAQTRADICTGRINGRPCEHNVSDSWITGAAGESARKLLSIKNNAQMRVDGEKRLHTCDACSCYLRLKVWTPLDHLLKHTTTEELANLPEFCWQRNERLAGKLSN